MKYIIFNDFAEIPVAILFPNRIGHEEMREQVPYTTVISAGYVELPSGGVIRCWGLAPDLMVSARPDEDAKIIARHFSETDSDI